MARPRPCAVEPSVPTVLSPALTGVPASGAKLSKLTGTIAGARGAAVLHARDHLLADEAALVEVDAAELVHVGLVRERIAVDEVEAAARDAERDAVRLVDRRLDQVRAEIGGGFARKMRRQHAAQPQRRKPRVARSTGRIRSPRRRPKPPARRASRTNPRR